MKKTEPAQLRRWSRPSFRSQAQQHDIDPTFFEFVLAAANAFALKSSFFECPHTTFVRRIDPGGHLFQAERDPHVTGKCFDGLRGEALTPAVFLADQQSDVA